MTPRRIRRVGSAGLLLALAGIAGFTLLNAVPPLLLKVLVDRVILPGEWEYLPLVIAAVLVAPARRPRRMTRPSLPRSGPSRA